MSLAPENHSFSKEFLAHCLVTLKTGTNFSYDLHRNDVKTHFSLRFDQALPFKIKGLKDGENFVGFEMSVVGHDEAEQLIKALELAAAELRWQANLPLEKLPYTPTVEEAEADARGRWLAAEVELLAILLFHGEREVQGGPTVWRFLRTQLRDVPMMMSGPVWSLLLEAYQKEQQPTLAWLEPHLGESQVLALLAAYNPDEAPAGLGEEEANALRLRIDGAIARYLIVALRGLQLELLDSIANAADEAERQTLLSQLRTLESQQAYLINRKV